MLGKGRGRWGCGSVILGEGMRGSHSTISCQALGHAAILCESVQSLCHFV